MMRVAGLLALGLLMGCGGGVKPEVVPPLEPVSGKVLLDGQPTAGVAVIFVPAGITKSGNGASATTNAEGMYTLKYRTGKEGIPQGEYIVLFSKMAMPDGSPIPEGKTAADVGAVDMIPEQYRSQEPPPYAASVPSGGKNFDFEIRTK